MADTGIMCNQADMLRRAGANINTALNATNDTTFTFSNDFIASAESYINISCKKNYSDTYASLNADVKALLRDAVACSSAMLCINYDMSGYTSRQEAQTMLDVLSNRVSEAIRLLTDKDKQAFINGA